MGFSRKRSFQFLTSSSAFLPSVLTHTATLSVPSIQLQLPTLFSLGFLLFTLLVNESNITVCVTGSPCCTVGKKKIMYWEIFKKLEKPHKWSNRAIYSQKKKSLLKRGLSWLPYQSVFSLSYSVCLLHSFLGTYLYTELFDYPFLLPLHCKLLRDRDYVFIHQCVLV